MKKQRLRFQYISLMLFIIYLLNLCVPCVSVQAEDSSLSDSLTEGGTFYDIAGHWAEREITAWTARGLAGGYPDGTFLPDSPITRAEFLTLVNRVFGYRNMDDTIANTVARQGISLAAYGDVAESDWYAAEVAKATAVGYLGGYPDGTMKPQNPITRQEVAAVLAKILPPAVVAENNAGFIDQAQIPEWSQGAIAATVNGGYMNGYPDGTFQPNRPITRAEALSVLDRAAEQLYNRAGTYGPFQGTVVLEGNVTINTPGVTLQNTTITGNLYLTEGIGEGDVTLVNATVQGTTKIAGGGMDSIHLRNTSVASALVNVPSRSLVRLLAQGSTMVGTLEARTPVRLEEEGLTGSGFTKVRICPAPPVADSSFAVELFGQFNEVEIQPLTVQPDLQQSETAQFTQFPQSTQSAQTQINLLAQTTIENLVANAPVMVQGQGTIENIQANVDGVIIEASVKNVLLAAGVQVMVNGKTITENY